MPEGRAKIRFRVIGAWVRDGLTAETRRLFRSFALRTKALLILSASIHSTNLTSRMSAPGHRTVPADEISAEWEEIRAAQAEPARFRPLYQRYYDPIFRFIFRRTADEALSADLCSQVFLKALQKLGGYENRGLPFSAWLFRIATNEVAQHYRQTARRRVVFADTGLLEELDGVTEETDEPARFTPTHLNAALQRLKPAELELIELRFFDQRPFKEIAELLDITESNAKVRTYRILDRLKKHLFTLHSSR